MRKGPLIFCIFLIVVAGYATYLASAWTFKAKLFPLSVSIPLFIIATIQLLQLIFEKEETPQGAAGVDLDFSSDVPPDVARRRVVNIFCWIVAFILSVYLFGFPLTVPLFIFLFLKFQSALSWIPTILFTVITWACFYTLFQWLVHIQFEAGVIPTWLGL